MSDQANTSRRPHGFTLVEAGVLAVLVTVVGGAIYQRMNSARDTGIRAAAKAQLTEAAIHVESVDEFEQTRPGFPGPGIYPDILWKSARTPIPEELVELIAVFDDTKTLDLTGTWLNENQLAQFQSFSQLEAVCLTQTLVGDEGLSVLAKFKELRELDLSYSLVKGPGLVHLKSLPKLERLWLASNELTDDCVSDLLEFPSLKEVDLSGTFVSDRVGKLIDAGIQLREMRGELAKVSFKELNFISRRNLGARESPSLLSDPDLEATIEIWRKIDRIAQQADTHVQMLLPPDGKVTCLTLRGASLNAGNLGTLAKLKSLTSLDIAVCRFPVAESLDSLNLLPHLRRVDLSRTNGQQILKGNFRWLANLESLQLRKAGLRDTDLKLISSSAPNVRVLNLNGNKITNAGIAALAGCTELEELSIRDTGITATEAEIRTILPTLKRLRRD